MKILYIGPINYGETCHQRMLALQELGHYIIVINTLPPEVKKKYDGFLYRLIRKIYGPLDFANINKQIEEYIKFGQIDLLWIDKGLTVYPETLLHVKQKFPNTIIAGYSPDDMTGNSNNQSRNFLNSLSYYDIYFTTKSYCVEELKALGCSKVIFVNNAFDPHIHKPLRITDEERIKLGGPVGFIGDYEKERASMLINLAQHSILVRVWGPNWHKYKISCPNLKIEGKPLLSEYYTKAICAFDINLCFLRKINRDLQTTRSIEIPACGAFMLAERTAEHQSLFTEGKEAEYFSSFEELLFKINYYLVNPEKRMQIAAAGRERCITSGYTNHDRLREMINIVKNIRATNDPHIIQKLQ